jgi:hypothetical protein
MNALYKLQQAFAADLWDEQLNQLDGVILDGRLPADRLFQVYRNNFWLSVEDALADIYPVVQRLVGPDFFSFLTDRFIRSHPPYQGNLHRLGGDLPGFLQDFKPAAGLPYLPDTARLEWAYHQVFHAADAQPYNAQALAGIPPEQILQIQFRLAPNCRLVCSTYPIFQIWRVNQADYVGDQQVDLAAGETAVLVIRPQWDVELRQLEQIDAVFLHCLINGCNLGEAAQVALQISPEFDLSTALARYLLPGILSIAPDT